MTRSSTLTFVAAVLLAAATAAAQESSPRPLQLGDYMDLVRLGDVEISADGARVLQERTAIDAASDSWVTSVWEVAADGSAERRLMSPASHPRIAPDGARVALLRSGQVWILPLTGGEPWQLTRFSESVSDFVWSPDSARLALVMRDRRAPPPPVVPELAASPLAIGGTAADAPTPGEWVPAVPESTPPQVEVLVPVPEAIVATVLPEPEEEAPKGAVDRTLPKVITRLQFKADGRGYVGSRRQHLHVIDVPDTPPTDPVRARPLTAGPWDDTRPAWAPDGRWIVFVSSRRAGAEDLRPAGDLWLVSPDGGEPIALTDTPGAESWPAWSPDGRWLAYLHTPADPPVYAPAALEMLGLYGGEPAEGAPPVPDLAPEEAIALTASLDRPVEGPPRWAPDGTSVYVTLQDRGTVPLVRVGTGLRPMGRDRPGGLRGLFSRGPRARPEDRGVVEPVISGPRAVDDFELLDEQVVLVTLTSGTEPAELFAAPLAPAAGAELPLASSNAHLQPAVNPPAAALRRLTDANQGWRQRVQLAEPEPLRFTSTDDAVVEGWLLRPPGAPEGTQLPTILRIHGGPVSQYSWAFSWELQYLAAQGYAVVYVNPRGSSGYGSEFAHAIWADWGGPDLQDLMAALDHLVERGIADRDRIGVGGWSYGGLMTNVLITRSDRFAAAISGAGESDYFSCYGTDDVQWWWEAELGLPYDPRAFEEYERLSPIRAVAAVGAPTLFVGGENDWRVPLAQSEQMYTQLRRRMIDGGPATGLIVYPGESHGISRPSFQIDRWARYKAWYDRHVLGDTDADPFFGERSW